MTRPAPPSPTRAVEVRHMICTAAVQAGGVRELAWAWGLSLSTIYHALRGRRPIGPCVLARLGIDPATVAVDGECVPPPERTPAETTRAVLDYCRAIPEGETIPYPEAAAALGMTSGALRLQAIRLARRGHVEAARLCPAESSSSRLGAGGIAAWHAAEPDEAAHAEYLARRDEVWASEKAVSRRARLERRRAESAPTTYRVLTGA
jgi:hypothetical protein